ncbi:hypothetical protein [Rhizobium sp. CNPSo 4039]|uniref:hypothetical protein n=1 Tax=Rhizobium sp. CNPSo 4039 TaxID=3021409 RepID=UPI00254F3F0B|nr:hypothetical protein [Rhizobium sp. CNPSo 4039]MDK4711088.1 hypothetical protein [Rhizobium sp. CNPSo 4039]
MSKLRVAILFGGQSTEHEVSVMSAAMSSKRSMAADMRSCRTLAAGGGKSAALPEPIAKLQRKIARYLNLAFAP